MTPPSVLYLLQTNGYNKVNTFLSLALAKLSSLEEFREKCFDRI